MIAALELRPGQTIADVGAGRGYLTFRLAQAVGPQGAVTATDVDASAVAALSARSRPSGSAPVEPRLVAPDDPGLERGRYDRIVLAEVDHLLPDRAAFLSRLRPALAAGGRIAVANRLLFRAPLVDAAARAGLVATHESEELPGHFFVQLEVKR
jgi:cyclopropane fatty-acyl-phospholipid synthase-like methyltransferase